MGSRYHFLTLLPAMAILAGMSFAQPLSASDAQAAPARETAAQATTGQANAKHAAAETRANALLKKMSLEEKIGQMAQITLDVVGVGTDSFSSAEPFALDTLKLRKALVDYRVGSILNTSNDRARTLEVWRGIIGDVQAMAMKKTRLGIPVLYGIDAIHGATYTAGATLFPQQIAQAAAFNRNLVRRAAEITAYEVRAGGLPWIFSPVLDLGADPRFPRQWETFGEDPFLGAALAKEMIAGYEGGDISKSDKVAACMKHFLGYQAPFSGKDRTPAFISEQALREYHLPAFQAAIEAGAHSIIINSSIINGVPVHSNYDIVTKLLKKELGFKGVVVTDWGDIDYLCNRDHIAKDAKEAVMIAVNAGIDLAMIPWDYAKFCDNLAALVKEGKVKRQRIDDAVRRILTLKYELGLFEKPTADAKGYPDFGAKRFEEAAYQTAAEALTLLKNEKGILPLAKGAKLLVTGPNANSMRTLNGAWSYSWQGEKTEEFASRYHTVLAAVKEKFGAENVSFVPGVSYDMAGKFSDDSADKMDDAVSAARKADAVILCVGENSYTEGPGNLDDLYLSNPQTELARKLAATGKPIILVLNEGRPRLIGKFADKMAAIVQTYLPGNFGGDALADLLIGNINPSGRLPYTYPRYPNALITYYHKPSEAFPATEEADKYHPQFEFGWGLSYTGFRYANLKLSRDTLKAGQDLLISVDVANTGKRAGKEAVLLYISDLVGEAITPDVKRLRGFEKIELNPGVTRQVNFTIRPEDIAVVDLKNKRTTVQGEFKVRVGDQTAAFFYK